MGHDVPVYARRLRSPYPRPSSRPCSGVGGVSQSWTNVNAGRRIVTAPSNPVPQRKVVSGAEARPEKPLNSNGIAHFSKDPRLHLLGPPGLEEACVLEAGEAFTYGKTGHELLRSNGDSSIVMVPNESPHKSHDLRPALELAPAPHPPYQWTPVQRRQHGFVESHGFLGTYVSSLSLNLSVDGAQWQDLELAPSNFHGRQPPRCCLVGDRLVLCTGMVRGMCPQDHDHAEGSNAYIARLPEGMRPGQALQFAGLARDASGKAGRRVKEPQLVSLVVTPDGWIQGISRGGNRGTIDLSAIRFSLARGMAIADEVRLITCDIQGRRMVILQGSLAESNFTSQGQTALAILPQACRLQSFAPFIVAGQRAGGFHLMTVKPAESCVTGADVIWSDGTLDHDMINLTGVMYECSPEALQYSVETADWTANRKKIVVFEFQKLLLKKFGTFAVAWQEAFDREMLGNINFTKFRIGCKAAGYSGNVSRLWAMLDDDLSGEIDLSEIAVDVGKLETIDVLAAPIASTRLQ